MAKKKRRGRPIDGGEVAGGRKREVASALKKMKLKAGNP